MKATHEIKTDWTLEQFNICECSQCGLNLVTKTNTFFGKNNKQTLPSLPKFQHFEICDGDCAN